MVVALCRYTLHHDQRSATAQYAAAGDATAHACAVRFYRRFLPRACPAPRLVHRCAGVGKIRYAVARA